MARRFVRTGVVLVMAVAGFVICVGEGPVTAATLNPEGVNPHRVAPRQRITLEQKQKAAEARKRTHGQPGKKMRRGKDNASRSPELAPVHQGHAR